MALSLLFFGAIQYSILESFCPGYFISFKEIQNNRQYAITLFLLINFFCAKKKKEIFNSKVASHIPCPLFVSKLPHECEDITKNAWRTSPNAQCNIEY